MMTSIISDVLSEAADSVLRQLPLTGDELVQAKALIMRSAIQSAEVQRKFSYALTDKAYVASGKGKAVVAPGYGAIRDEELPSLRMPNVARIRQKRMRLRMDQLLSNSSVEFFNRHYVKDIDLDFSHTWHHDHPEAASSKKIETEIVMDMLRSRHADLLRTPSNGYDFSIIDSGGDWRYHHVRKRVGVHVDAPFLDDRDKSRDARKRMQLTKDAENHLFVCRNLSQTCMLSAPFMMAVQSILYTSTLLSICETMASRGVLYFVGTMHLPEQLRDFSGKYVDGDYGYTIEYSHRDAMAGARYLPPQVRHGFGKYLFTDIHQKVTYRYPSGESREYVHDLAVLQEKLDPQTFIIPTAHGAVYTYKYRVVRRVGSLAYVELAFVDDKRPAHSRLMASVSPRPYDGYQVMFDENLIRDFQIRAVRSPVMNVPRQLFTTVAAYCLTKVRDPNFQIESAVSYARSAVAQIEANGIPIHRGSNTDAYALLVVAGAAAFFWAFDRYRLMDSRLSELRLADTQQEVQTTLTGKIDSMIGFGEIYKALKEGITSTLMETAAEYAIGKATTYDDIRQMYESMTSMSSPGLHHIRDMHVCYRKLQELRVDGPHVAHHVGQAAVEAMVPVYPTYELEQTKQLIEAKKDPVRRHEEQSEGSGGKDSGIGMGSDEKEVVVGAGHNVAPIIHDMITMSEAAETERDQTAQEVYLRVFDPDRRAVRSMEDLKGTIKGQPTLVHYIEGILYQVQTLVRVFNRGDNGFDEVVESLVGSRFIYPEKVGSKVVFGTGTMRADTMFRSDRHERTQGQTFSALLDPTLKVMNAEKLRQLRELVGREPISIDTLGTTLADEVAGSGKTHKQCMTYQEIKAQGKSVAIFASTKIAASQAEVRLKAWGVEIDEGSISSVDAFLMNPKRWKSYEYVMIDEALQLHAGKIYGIIFLTKARVVQGFGDTHQIGYIPFTRFHQPSVVTNFPWATIARNMSSRRIPQGIVVSWLQSERLYGPQFKSVSQRPEGLQLYIQLASFESHLSLPILYKLMGIKSHHQLLILVFLQDEALRLRSKLMVGTDFPSEGELTLDEGTKHNACVKSVGESQGDDVDHVVLLRLATRQEPLYMSPQQTTVALTRQKIKFGMISVVSKFPTLIEEIGGTPTLVPSLAEGVSQKLLADSF